MGSTVRFQFYAHLFSFDKFILWIELKFFINVIFNLIFRNLDIQTLILITKHLNILTRFDI